MPARARCHLHIGAEKTGSTSIQRFLATNRGALLQRGILYPKSLGAINHLHVPAFALPDAALDDDIRRLAFRQEGVAELAPFRSAVEKAFADEVRGSEARSVIVSNEHCHSRVTDPESVARVRDLLRTACDEIAVVVYLRRQDRLSVSSYSSALRAGWAGRGPNLPDFGVPGDYQSSFYDFAGLIQRYAEVFGMENIRVRLFERASLTGGDSVIDFCDVCGIDDAASLEQVSKKNEALSYRAQHYLRQFNESSAAWQDSKQRNRVRHALVESLSRDTEPKYPPIDEATARAFVGQYETSNEWVRRRFFPDREALFDDDYAVYETYGDRPELSFEAATELTAALLEEMSVAAAAKPRPRWVRALRRLGSLLSR